MLKYFSVLSHDSYRELSVGIFISNTAEFVICIIMRSVLIMGKKDHSSLSCFFRFPPFKKHFMCYIYKSRLKWQNRLNFLENKTSIRHRFKVQRPLANRK